MNKRVTRKRRRQNSISCNIHSRTWSPASINFGTPIVPADGTNKPDVVLIKSKEKTYTTANSIRRVRKVDTWRNFPWPVMTRNYGVGRRKMIAAERNLVFRAIDPTREAPLLLPPPFSSSPFPASKSLLCSAFTRNLGDEVSPGNFYFGEVIHEIDK